MKSPGWHFLLGSSLLAASAALYLAHFLIFRDPHHIFIYMLGDLAFLPAEVLLVSVIIHRLLVEREKRAMLQKMNMVIGAFFSEVGTSLLKSLTGFDDHWEQIKDNVVFKRGSVEEFAAAGKFFMIYRSRIDSRAGSLSELRGFLVQKREFLLRLLENPILLDHETFADLLWAVFHLAEELEYRQNVDNLSRADYSHLSEDMTRAYTSLISEWLKYMRHLRVNYPYLFSLALRINPFDPDVTPELK